MKDLAAMQSFERSRLDRSKLCSFDNETIEAPTAPLIHQEARFLYICEGHGVIRIQGHDVELRPNTLLSILPWKITAVTEVAEPLQYHLVIYNLHTLNRYIRAFSDERGDAVDWLAHIERQPALYCNEGQAHRMQQFFLSLREEVGLESILGAAPPKVLGSLAVVNRLVELVILMERFRAEQPEPAAADRASAAPDSRSSAAGATCPSTGCIRASERRCRKSARPSSRMSSGGMPSSSHVSRRAHCSGVSPGSMRPPGKQTSPLWWCRVGERTSYSRLRPSAVSATGTSTA